MLVAAALALLAVPVAPASAAFPGDNGRVAFCLQSTSGDEIFTMQPDGSDVRGLAYARNPAWSPDGRELAYNVLGGGIYVIAFDGSGGATQLVGQGEFPSWSPDGTKIVYTRASGGQDALSIVDVETKAVTNLTSPDGSFVADSSDMPAWSPDGSTIVFHRAYLESVGDDNHNGLWAISPDGTGMHALVDYAQSESASYGVLDSPSWSPDGGQIAFRYDRGSTGDQVATIPAEGGTPSLVTSGGLTHQYRYPAWSPDGTATAYSTSNSNDGGHYGVVVDGNDVYTAPNSSDRICGLDWAVADTELLAGVGPPSEPVGSGEEFDLHVYAFNAGTQPITGVTPSTPTMSGDGAAQLLSGPEPSEPVDLTFGGYSGLQDFVFHYRATAAGTVTFHATVSGTGPGGPVTSAEASEDATITPAGLTSAVTLEPSTVANGETTKVTVTATNEGDQTLTDVAPSGDPTASSSDGGEAEKQDGPSPASAASLAPGAKAEFVYTYHALQKGTVTFDASVQGTLPDTSTTSGDFTCVAGDAACTLTVRPAPLVVNTTGDEADAEPGAGGCDTGGSPVTMPDSSTKPPCTLRAAIQEANASAGEHDEIHFDVPGSGSTPPTIAVASALPQISDPTDVDGSTQPEAGSVRLDGGGSVDVGLDVTAGDSVLRGLQVKGFPAAEIRLQGGGGNTVAGNLLGFFSGSEFRYPKDTSGNGTGIVVSESADNRIGGAGAADRNVISDAGDVTGPLVAPARGEAIAVVVERQGISVEGAGSTGNVIAGNYIGTDRSGAETVKRGSLPQPYYLQFSGNAGYGVRIMGAADNTIGAGNVISGNLLGNVLIEGSGAHGNAVLGSTIGLDAAGTLDPDPVWPLPDPHLPDREPVGTAAGVHIVDAQDNTVGGAGAGEGNVIAGNTAFGVRIEGAASHGNAILGNRIGVTAGGVPIGNGILLEDPGGVVEHGTGIAVSAAGGTRVGGTAAGEGNLIGDTDAGAGIAVSDGAAGTAIRGNQIGVTAGGADVGTALGIDLDGSSGSVVGGADPAAANVIGDNGTGVEVGGGATGGQIEGNSIGVTSAAASAGNGEGVVVVGDGSQVAIGGAGAGEANVIAHSHGDAVRAMDASRATIRRNSIFDNGFGIELVEPAVGPGPNHLQPAPVLVAIERKGQMILRGGLADSASSTTFQLDVFANDSCTADGYGQGKRFLLGAEIATGIGGQGGFQTTTAISAEHLFTATATDPEGNTSEFSRCVALRKGGFLTASAHPGDTEIQVDDTTPFSIGDWVAIDPGTPSEDDGQITGFGSLILDRPLQHDHGSDAAVVRLDGPPPGVAPISPPGTPAPPASPPAEPPSPAVTPDRTAPVISHVELSHRKFRVAPQATPVKATVSSQPHRRSRHAPAGAALRFTLSEPAAVTIAIARELSGRRVGHTCRKPSHRLRKRKRCVRLKTIGTLKRKVKSKGAKQVAITGRIGSRKRRLTPGRYRLTIGASDAAGNAAERRTVRFRVVGH